MDLDRGGKPEGDPMSKDIDFTEFLRECGMPEPTWWQKELIKHLESGVDLKACMNIRPRGWIPLVPGPVYVCPSDTMEHQRRRAESQGMVLVEIKSPQPGSSAYRVVMDRKADQ
jgi:hypothetical protein